MVWLDIEGSSYWTTPAANRSFVEEILKAFKAHGYVVGLYVNHTQWVEIFGADYKGCGGFPTWVAKYSTPVSKDCSTLSPFGPYATKDFNLRQYTGTTALCGGSVDQSAYC
jgi:GH25 family lysozyme M1 (1,4-beta-N-acetylmuramidase)